MKVDVLVIGAGIIGLSTAYEAARKGLSVCIAEKENEIGFGASNAAAGILLSSDLDGYKGSLGDFNKDSVNEWVSWHKQLQIDSGVNVGFRPNGRLYIAYNEQEHNDYVLPFMEVLGKTNKDILKGSDVLKIERDINIPYSGLHIQNSASVNNIAVLQALHSACLKLDVKIIYNAEISEYYRDGERFVGGIIKQNETNQMSVTAENTVIATGAWSSMMKGLPYNIPVRPLAGEYLIVHSDKKLCHGIVSSNHGLTVPRANGIYWVGVTVLNRGFVGGATVESMSYIINHQSDILPGLNQATVKHVGASFRPDTPDHNPIIGFLAPGLIAATGHRREGILQTPLTAKHVVSAISNGSFDESIKVFSPKRFQTTESRTFKGKRV